jgi:predicted AlkP superfamily phosphohydrolase/phosphomutase
MDCLLGRVRSKLRPGDVLYVISDHGFAPFRREFNLVRWLEAEGYLAYRTPLLARLSKSYKHVDWARTRAYAVGFNGLYVNLAGREAAGCVAPADRDRLVEEIRARLLAARDTNGERIFSNVYRREEIYRGPHVEAAPDLVLGYSAGYGPSDASAVGTWAEDVVAPHVRGFSGHHAVDYKLVPGVLLSTRKLPPGPGRLQDVTVTVLSEFGIPPVDGMTGRSLRSPPAGKAPQ